MIKAINICLATDDNYARHCAAAIASIIANADKEDRIRFHILCDRLSGKSAAGIAGLAAATGRDDCEIRFVAIDPKDFDGCPIPEGGYVRKANYYRLMIPWLLPELERVLYLDCDMIVLSSLSALFNADLGGMPAAMVPDEYGDKHRKDLVADRYPYFNSGVILIDCRRWREEHLKDAIFEWVPKNIDRIRIADQDILNALLQGRILELNRKYNLFDSLYTAGWKGRWNAGDLPVVMHFVGSVKPWDFVCGSPSDRLYFSYLNRTPWRREKYRHFFAMTPAKLRKIRRKILRALKHGLYDLNPNIFTYVKSIYVKYGGKPI